jgi:membrane-associated phospholipid phosphatase
VTGLLRAAQRRLAAHWRLKLALSASLTVGFCVPYFALQRLVVFPILHLSPSIVDDAVGFVPEWVWIYQSVYLLLAIVPWLADSADDLHRYARGFIVQAAIGFLFFFFLPIAAPRPDAFARDVMFRLLVSYDRPLNTFPSLHVGLSVYTLLFAATVSRGRRSTAARTGSLVVLAGWVAAIAFSAVATKQHYAIDLPAGAFLAWVSHRWAFRPSPERNVMLKRSGLALPLVLWMLCVGSPLASRQIPPVAPLSPAVNAQEEADHESLRMLRGIYEQAIRENRVDLIQPHLHSDFHGVMVTGRAVNSFADLEQYWREIRDLMGEGGSYTTTLKPELSTIVGDIALARGTTDDVVRTDRGEYRFSTLWTATLQREGPAWKIRYVQGTMDPVGNPFVREFAKRAITRTAVIGVAGGLIVGLAVGILWQRRRTRRAA